MENLSLRRVDLKIKSITTVGQPSVTGLPNGWTDLNEKVEWDVQ